MSRHFVKSTVGKRAAKPVTYSLLSITCFLIAGLVSLMLTSESRALTCPTLSIDDQVIVRNVGKPDEEGTGLNVRKEPRVNNDEKSIPRVYDGTTGTVRQISQGPKYIWYWVNWNTTPEIKGWSVGIYDGDKVIMTTSEASQKDKLVEKLFRLNPGEADTKTKHDYNDYKCYPVGFSDDTQGYNGGHSGWDARTNPQTDPKRDAYFYSLTAGEVIRAKSLFIDEGRVPRF